MHLEDAKIPDVKIITHKKHVDARGFFSEVYRQSDWRSFRPDCVFIQDNHAYSASIGTLRGLHFQIPPFAQDKLVRVTRGRIFDVAVDIRRGSATYGQYVAIEVSAENWRQVFVPVGFAHGYVTMEPDTEVLYKVTAAYSPSHNRGLVFDDPELGIDWPVPPSGLVLSETDRTWPVLKHLDHIFP